MVPTTPIDDAGLLASLESRELPCEAFHHRQHLRAAWLFLRRAGDFARGALEFRAALLAFATGCGAAGKYHETLTWAWLLLVHERMEQGGAADSEAFLAAHPDLLDGRRALAAHYPLEQLASERARRVFLLPVLPAELR